MYEDYKVVLEPKHLVKIKQIYKRAHESNEPHSYIVNNTMFYLCKGFATMTRSGGNFYVISQMHNDHIEIFKMGSMGKITHSHTLKYCNGEDYLFQLSLVCDFDLTLDDMNLMIGIRDNIVKE